MEYNIKAFENLKEHYQYLVDMPYDELRKKQLESSDAEDIEGLMEKETGFGDSDTCYLCLAARQIAMEETGRAGGFCSYCMWNYPSKRRQSACVDYNGYRQIKGAWTPYMLQDALKLRIRSMNRKIKLYYKDLQNEVKNN